MQTFIHLVVANRTTGCNLETRNVEAFDDETEAFAFAYKCGQDAKALYRDFCNGKHRNPFFDVDLEQYDSDNTTYEVEKLTLNQKEKP